MTYELTAEERDILEKFERNELPPIPNAEQEKEHVRQAARNTMKRMESANANNSEQDPHRRPTTSGTHRQKANDSCKHSSIAFGRLEAMGDGASMLG